MKVDLDALLQPTLYDLQGFKQTWGGKRPMTEAEFIEPRRHHLGTNPGKMEWLPAEIPEIEDLKEAISKKAQLWLQEK
jgi:hypothetical protein